MFAHTVWMRRIRPDKRTSEHRCCRTKDYFCLTERIKRQQPMDKKDITQIDFDRIKDFHEVDYTDEGIALHADIRELPIDGGTIRINMLTIVACTDGKMQFELNAQAYTLHRNEVLVCRPNDMIDNCMLSPDFGGAVLCLSQRGVLEQMSESELWDKAFYFATNPIVRVSEKNQRMYNLYSAILLEKIKSERSPYHREIIVAVVKAMLYELLASVEKEKPVAYGSGLIRQREVLFKRFIELLSGTRIKPRSVSWYADRLCVTPKYLSTVSKQVSGKTAFEWINEYVLIDIRFWLKQSNKTIKEIANMLNFPNISFFGKYCRTHFGVSPTEYRKQLREHPTAEH